MACGCGRSPVNGCVGWHSLSEDEYQTALAQWNSLSVGDSMLDNKDPQGEIIKVADKSNE